MKKTPTQAEVLKSMSKLQKAKLVLTMLAMKKLANEQRKKDTIEQLLDLQLQVRIARLSPNHSAKVDDIKLTELPLKPFNLS